MAPPVSRPTIFSTTLVELPMIKSDSNWPITISLFGGVFLAESSAPNSCTCACSGKNFFRVAGTSLLDTGITEHSMYPFFAKVGEIRLELAAFVFGVEQDQESHELLVLALPSILCECEGHLALRQ